MGALGPVLGAAAGKAIIGGVVGQVIGGIAGFYLGNEIINRGLDTNKLGDIPLQGTDDGAPAPFHVGPYTRHVGHIIQLANVSVNTVAPQGGSKGGSGPKSEVAVADIAVLICKNRDPVANASQIQSVRRVWADGTLIYEANPQLNPSDPSGNIVSDELSSGPIKFDLDVDEGYVVVISSPLVTGPDLTKVKSGIDVTMSGWSTGALNGTFRVLGSSKLLNTTKLRLKVPTEIASEAAGNTITLSQTLPVFTAGVYFSDVTFYLGTGTQDPDPILEADVGTGNQPAYRYKAYAMFERYNFVQHGNRVPNFVFESEADSGPTTRATVIEEVLRVAGLSSSQWDTDGVTGESLGYSTEFPQRGRTAIEPFLLAHNIVGVERGPILTFFDRSSATVVPVDPNDLAAYASGEQQPPIPFDIVDEDDPELPKYLSVRYKDADKDLQIGSVREQRETYRGKNRKRFAIPETLTEAQARGIALRLLHQAHSQREILNWQLPPSYASRVLPGVILTCTVDGKDWRQFVISVDESPGGVLEVQTLEEIEGLDTFTAVGGKVAIDQTKYTPPDVRAHPMDPAALQQGHVNLPGYYVGAIINGEQQYASGDLYESIDSGTTWNFVKTLTSELTGGVIVEVGLDEAASFPAVYTSNTPTTAIYLNVEMFKGELSSTTMAGLLNGDNWLWVGTQGSKNPVLDASVIRHSGLIGFRSASYQGNNIYRLTNLLFGRREYPSQEGVVNWTRVFANATNAVGKPVALLNSAGVDFIQKPFSAYKQNRIFKIVPLGGTLAEAEATNIFTPGLATAQPFTPVHLTAEKQTNGDILFRWVRRSKGKTKTFGPELKPIFEFDERYRIQIINSPFFPPTVWRTVDDVVETQYLWDVATQTSDAHPDAGDILISDLGFRVFPKSDAFVANDTGTTVIPVRNYEGGTPI